MKVILADDHRIVREGLRWMLEGEPDVEIVGECGDGSSAVAEIEAAPLEERSPDASTKAVSVAEKTPPIGASPVASTVAESVTSDVPDESLAPVAATEAESSEPDVPDERYHRRERRLGAFQRSIRSESSSSRPTKSPPVGSPGIDRRSVDTVSPRSTAS